jgi:hypothetical protein
VDWEIESFRLSMIWTEEYPEVLQAPDDGTAGKKALTGGDKPKPFISSRREYEEAFESRDTQPDTSNQTAVLNQFVLPWNDFKIKRKQGKGAKEQKFLEYYLNLERTDRAKGCDAWRHMVPSRISNLPYINWRMKDTEYKNIEIAIRKTAYTYPYGSAFVLTVSYNDEELKLNPYKLTKVADVLRYQRYLTFSDDDIKGNPYAEQIQADTLYSPDQIADIFLDAIRDKVFRLKPSYTKRPEPFTIFTVTKGNYKGENNKIPEIAQNDDVHKVLDTLARWNNGLDNETEPYPLKTASIPVKDKTAKRVLYASDRSRVIWFPIQFIPKKKGRLHKLTFYHENLAAASMHTDSLCGLLCGTARMLGQGKKLSPTLNDEIYLASIIIEKLFKGDRTTYRSNSIPRQISDAGYLDGVNRIRKYFNMEPLIIS